MPKRLNAVVGVAVIISFYALFISLATALNQYVYRTLPELAYWFVPLSASCIISAISIYVWKRLRETDMLRYEFITIVAHKFRTPLTHIKWVCESLVATEKDSERKEYLLMVHTSNEHLIDFTGMIIQAADTDVSSRRTYRFARYPLKDLVTGMVQMVTNAFHSKKIHIGIRIPDDLFVSVDEQRIKFVFQTLLENAHAYTPEGGSVTLSAEKHGEHVIIRISDTGIGIDPKDIPHLFSKFYRTDKAMHTDTEGFGIGLYLVKTVVEKHNGKIDVRSDGENTGTTFVITLPSA